MDKGLTIADQVLEEAQRTPACHFSAWWNVALRLHGRKFFRRCIA
jgi:hypothetical protein